MVLIAAQPRGSEEIPPMVDNGVKAFEGENGVNRSRGVVFGSIVHNRATRAFILVFQCYIEVWVHLLCVLPPDKKYGIS